MNSHLGYLRAIAAEALRPPAILLAAASLFLGVCGSADLSLLRSATASEPQSQPSLAARTGYMAFETFGRDDSLLHVEMLPYIEADQVTLFSDVRFFVSDEGLFGGNVGFGYRYRLFDTDRFVGGSFWYDIDDTTGQLFHQIGLGFETYGSNWDFRSNFYLPVGITEQDFQIAVTNQRFVGNQIVYDGSRTHGEAMEGVDLEFGVPFPTQFGARHRVTANVGGYWFFGDKFDDIQGVKCRIEGNLTERVAMQVEATHDDTFDTNVMLGISIEFPGVSSRRDSETQTMVRQANEFSRRNYNIIVSRQEDVQTNVTAINSSTGQPYDVQHVSSTAGGPNLGTVDDPYQTIAAAQAAGGDIIFVHAGSVLSAPLVMAAGDTILGEGVDHLISYGSYGSFLLPTATTGTVVPTLQGVAGTAVTLASNSTLAGFTIDSPSGHGIFGNAVAGVTLRDIDVVNAALDGILLQQMAGSNTFTNVNVRGASGSALHIDGGTADVAFQGAIENTTGRALVVENTTAGEIDLEAATIDGDGGEGILFDNANGNVALGTANVLNSTGTGISVQDSAGTLTFNDVHVENSASTGIDVQNASGSVGFGTLAADGINGARGLSIVDSSAEVSINNLDLSVQNATALHVRNGGLTTITGGTIASTGGSAVDIEATETDIALTSVSSDGAGVGIRIVDNPGSFYVNGNGSPGSGGLIQNATTGVLLDNANIVALHYMDLDGNDVGVSTTNTEHFGLAHSRVTNSTNYGIDSLNSTTFEVMGSTFQNNGGATTNAIRAGVDAAGDYEVAINTSSFDDDSAAAVSIFSSGAGNGATMSLLFEGNDVTTSLLGADGFRLSWDGPIVAVVRNNTFHGTGGSNDGIDIAFTSATEYSQLGVYGNTLTFDNGDDVGVRISTLGPSLLAVETSNFTFDGTNGVGVDFTLAESAEVFLYRNVINFNASGEAGVQFTSIDGPGEVNFNANQIDLVTGTGTLDYGIRFISVTDTIAIAGNQNNLVSGAAVPFFAPVGTTTGNTYVNGAAVP